MSLLMWIGLILLTGCLRSWEDRQRNEPDPVDELTDSMVATYMANLPNIIRFQEELKR